MEEVSRDVYEFLQQWFQLFPEYQTNEFYNFGESYAGKNKAQIESKSNASFLQENIFQQYQQRSSMKTYLMTT